jgi:hypothetical protein
MKEGTAISNQSVTIEIPPLYCPYPGLVHPRAKQIIERSLAWGKRFNLLPAENTETYVADNKAGAAGAMCLGAGDPTIVQIGADLTVLAMAIDDFFEVGMAREGSPAGEKYALLTAEVMPRVLRTLYDPQVGLLDDYPHWGVPYTDLAARFRAGATHGNLDRWVHGHRMWWEGMRWELACQQSGIQPDLNLYLLMRMGGVGALAVLPMVEQLSEDRPSENELARADVRVLQETACLMFVFHNDLFSYGKESWILARNGQAPDDCFNLVRLIARDECLSLDDALGTTADWGNQVMHLFVAASERVEKNASPGLRDYVAGVRNMVAGTLHWHPGTGRYTNPHGEGPGAINVSSTITTTPPPYTGPPTPSLARWWALLDDVS